MFWGDDYVTGNISKLVISTYMMFSNIQYVLNVDGRDEREEKE
jgi:hypothetical protein